MNNVTDNDVLSDLHYGRESDWDDDYLDILKTKLTLFNNAKCKNFDYQSWLNRYLPKMLNNQAGNIVVDIYDGKIKFMMILNANCC